MDVRIDELHTTTEIVGSDALLTPEVLSRLVAAVRAAIAAEDAAIHAVAAELDLRSVVQQQRDGAR